MIEDRDALACLACSPHALDYPQRHGYHLAALAMLIGAQMQLGLNALVDLGTGCMLHDIGMNAIGLEAFDNSDKLSSSTLRLLADHPVRAVDTIGKMGNDVSLDAVLVAYQIHERCDGSGYPRGRSRKEIHLLARIAAVADAFIGMLSERKHREAIGGYWAMSMLLNEMTSGRYDPKVIRSLLEVVSLHPVGSYVKLNNDKQARVVRSSGQQYDRPTIELDPDTKNPTVICLVEHRDIQIVCSIAPPVAA